MGTHEEDILDVLRGQGRAAVMRIMLLRDKHDRPTKHVILMFSSNIFPTSINAGYLDYKARSAYHARGPRIDCRHQNKTFFK